MTVKRKPKRMTSAEKRLRTELKKELQEKGVLPPDKPKLNRKKYVEEARQEWNRRGKDCLVWDVYLYKAISIMLGATDKQFRVSLEAIGVAKCLKLAIRLKEFSDKLAAEGRNEYTLGEELEYIKDILNA